MRRLKSIGVMSLGKVMGMSGALLGAIFGVLYGVVVIVASVMGLATEDGGLGAFGILGGVALMIGIPIFYGLGSFVFGLLYGLILNVVLGMAGGLELELE